MRTSRGLRDGSTSRSAVKTNNSIERVVGKFCFEPRLFGGGGRGRIKSVGNVTDSIRSMVFVRAVYGERCDRPLFNSAPKTSAVLLKKRILGRDHTNRKRPFCANAIAVYDVSFYARDRQNLRNESLIELFVFTVYDTQSFVRKTVKFGVVYGLKRNSSRKARFSSTVPASSFRNRLCIRFLRTVKTRF